MNLEINKINITGLKITIIGLKRSGYAAALLGHELGANIFVSELNTNPEIFSKIGTQISSVAPGNTVDS